MAATSLQTVLSALRSLTDEKLKHIDERYAVDLAWVTGLTATRVSAHEGDAVKEADKGAGTSVTTDQPEDDPKENKDEAATPNPRSRPRKSAAKRVSKKSSGAPLTALMPSEEGDNNASTNTEPLPAAQPSDGPVEPDVSGSPCDDAAPQQLLGTVQEEAEQEPQELPVTHEPEADGSTADTELDQQESAVAEAPQPPAPLQATPCPAPASDPAVTEQEEEVQRGVEEGQGGALEAEGGEQENGTPASAAAAAAAAATRAPQRAVEQGVTPLQPKQPPAEEHSSGKKSQRSAMKTKSPSLDSLATPRVAATGGKRGSGSKKKKAKGKTPGAGGAGAASASAEEEASHPRSPEPATADKGAGPSALGKRRIEAADTPVQELSEELLNAKTVSTRKKRPKTPYDFTFDIPMSLTFPCAATEPGQHQGAATPAAKGLAPMFEKDPMEEEEAAREAEELPIEAAVAMEEDKDAADEPEITRAASVARAAAAAAVVAEDVVPETPEAETEAARIAAPGGSGNSNAGSAAAAATTSTVTAPSSGGSRSGGNVVTHVRSFVPLVKGQQAVQPPPAAGKSKGKVKALEAAEHARKAAEEKEKDRAKRLEALKMRREQNKAGAPPGVSKIAAAGAGPKPLSRFGAGAAAAGKAAPSAAAGAQSHHQHAGLKTSHAQRRADDEAARKARDEQERKDRQERIKRMHAQREKIREDQAGRKVDKPAPAGNGLVKKAAPAAPSAAIPGPAKVSAGTKPSAAPAVPAQPGAPRADAGGSPDGSASELQYEISPYKSASDSDSDEEDERRSRKPIPGWAMTHNLVASLKAQEHVDPDEIFQQKHVKTCNLEDMFRDITGKSYSRRGSTGNWIEDRVTWQEEIAYKKSMGYRSVC